jgi:hypothetical protein
MSAELVDLATRLEDLNTEDLDHLGAALRTRAAERRARRLTVEEASEAVCTAPLSTAWESSSLADVGRVRIATRALLERGWHAEQVVEAMCTVALALVPHPSIAPEAVAMGIADAEMAR